MHKRILTYILILFSLNSLLVAQTEPPELSRKYNRYASNPDPYSYDGAPAFPDSGLVATTGGSSGGEPIMGYPYHTGSVVGVSDTIIVRVGLINRDSTAFSLTSYEPDGWFQPIGWEYSMNPTIFSATLDTSVIQYAFQGYYDGFRYNSKPSSLPDKGFQAGCMLDYKIWNLPAGKYRILMTATSSIISDVTVLINYVTPTWIDHPSSLADTLNAYANCYWRSFNAKNYTVAASWCDTMLNYNPFSVSAYLYKSKVYSYQALNDSLIDVSALDSTIAIMERYGDPALGDTATWNQNEWFWYDDILSSATAARWILINGEQGIQYVD